MHIVTRHFVTFTIVATLCGMNLGVHASSSYNASAFSYITYDSLPVGVSASNTSLNATDIVTNTIGNADAFGIASNSNGFSTSILGVHGFTDATAFGSAQGLTPTSYSEATALSNQYCLSFKNVRPPDVLDGSNPVAAAGAGL